jgi:hypothetical protein
MHQVLGLERALSMQLLKEERIALAKKLMM